MCVCPAGRAAARDRRVTGEGLTRSRRWSGNGAWGGWDEVDCQALKCITSHPLLCVGLICRVGLNTDSEAQSLEPGFVLF